MNACFRLCWRLMLVLALALNPLAGIAAPFVPEPPPPCAEMAGGAGMAETGAHDSSSHAPCPCCADQAPCPESVCASMACAPHFVAMIGPRATSPSLSPDPPRLAGRGANPVTAPAPGRLLRPPIA